MVLLAGQLMFLHTNFWPKMNLQLPLSVEDYTRHEWACARKSFDGVPFCSYQQAWSSEHGVHVRHILRGGIYSKVLLRIHHVQAVAAIRPWEPAVC